MPIISHKISPHLWFDKEAVDAARFYCSIFPDSELRTITVLPETPSGNCEVVSFSLCGQPFMAISAGPLFKFNEAVSFMVLCESQEEMDYYTKALSAHPEAEQCGWIKDKYGLSWQITPTALGEMFEQGTEAQVRELTKAMLSMKRLDLRRLKEAFASACDEGSRT